MKDKEIQLAFHYLSLHKSDYYTNAEQNTPELPNCDRLVRLPMYFELSDDDVSLIISQTKAFFI